jgi:hypothetical protein
MISASALSNLKFSPQSRFVGHAGVFYAWLFALPLPDQPTYTVTVLEQDYESKDQKQHTNTDRPRK